MLPIVEGMLVSTMDSARRGNQALRPWAACFLGSKIMKPLI